MQPCRTAGRHYSGGGGEERGGEGRGGRGVGGYEASLDG